MRQSRLKSQFQGHRLPNDSNRDISNKLGYQQLLALNHDLSRQNAHLKNIGNRLGNELKSLHSQFQMQPREENVELYNAINAHPILHRLQSTLLPLLDAYQLKIQQFQSGFETINEEFTNLEKKYEEVVQENVKLRTQLTDKIGETVELYKGIGSEKLGGDFSQIVLQQLNEKQRILVQENTRLEKESQRAKAENEKQTRDVLQGKRKLQECLARVQKAESKQDHLSKQNKQLKQELFTLQTKTTTLQSEIKQVQSQLERAESQVLFLNKNKEGLMKNIDRLRQACEQKENIHSLQTDHRSSSRSFYENKPKSSNSDPQQDDSHKKMLKLQKELDVSTKQKGRLKDQLQQALIPLQQLRQRCTNLQKRLSDAQQERNNFQTSDMKNKKLLQRLQRKGKDDLQAQRKRHEEDIDSLQAQHSKLLKQKGNTITELIDELEKSNIQRKKIQQELDAYINKESSRGDKGKTKGNDRAVQYMEQKLKINEEIFNTKMEIMENDYNNVKKISDELKEENRKKSEQLRETKIELERLGKDYEKEKEERTLMKEEIKRLRDLYETSLKDKERLFDQKIKEIKRVVEESERKRKLDKSEVQRASREYKKVLEQIKNTYEDRIKIMEAQLLGYSKTKKNDY